MGFGWAALAALALISGPPRADADGTLVSPVFVLGVMKSGTTALYGPPLPMHAQMTCFDCTLKRLGEGTPTTRCVWVIEY